MIFEDQFMSNIGGGQPNDIAGVYVTLPGL